MLHIALYQPEIPPNTGNIMRLAANTGCQLHLIEPLGFSIDEKQCRRAALDYREFASVEVHKDYQSLLAYPSLTRVFACTTKASLAHTDPHFKPGDCFLMGPETKGLPLEIIESLPEQQRLRIPMLPESRSLNLSNATAVMVYEAWRQLGFDGS